MMQYVNQLHDNHFIVEATTDVKVFKYVNFSRDPEGELAYKQLCAANDVKPGDLMIRVNIVDPDNQESLMKGIKRIIGGGEVTYNPMVNYIPVTRFPIDQDVQINIPMRISDNYGNCFLTMCPIILYVNPKRVEGKSMGQVIINAIQACVE